MDGRGSVCPPYRDALALGAWAYKNRPLIHGRVALAGGDPDRLTLRSFLDSAYVLLVEDYQHMGSGRVPINMAVSAADELIEHVASGGKTPLPTVEEAPASVPSPADNDRAMAELQGLMGGFAGNIGG